MGRKQLGVESLFLVVAGRLHLLVVLDHGGFLQGKLGINHVLFDLVGCQQLLNFLVEFLLLGFSVGGELRQLLDVLAL